MLDRTMFQVDREKCVGCGKCTKVCAGNVVGGSILTMRDGVLKDRSEYIHRFG